MAEYEVSSKLNVDTEDFERKVDNAISKVNALKEALESLNDIEIESIKSAKAGYSLWRCKTKWN